MQVIGSGASAWHTVPDVYAALFTGLGAPAWHGRNLDALNDSLTSGDINAVAPPLRVEVAGPSAAGPEARALAARIADLFADRAAEGHAVAWVVR